MPAFFFNFGFTQQDRDTLTAILSLVQEVQQTMATQADLDTALGQQTAAITQLGTDMNKSFADLLAKIQAGQDFTAEVQTIQAQIAQLQGFDTTAKQDDPGGGTPTP